MVNLKMEHKPIYPRSNLVCIACHQRKVKCNLQESQDNSCRNCRRSNQTCIPRDRLRRRRKPQNIHNRSLEPTERCQYADSNEAEDSASCSLDEIQQQPDGFISPSVLMSYDANRDKSRSNADIHPKPNVRDAVLKATQADVLPRPALRQALTDAFFEHIYHFCPVVDAADLTGPKQSLLVQQTVCLGGSLVRHDRDSINLTLSLYEKVKTLIYLNMEVNKLALLKALCILPFYSVLPTDQVTLDGPWHWVGMAIRTAIQMGLHSESTCVDQARTACRRRIFWYLIQADNMCITCWGRPSAFIPNDCDIPPPTLQDFEVQNIQASVFIAMHKLSTITGKVAQLHMKPVAISADDISKLAESLGDWIRTLPAELQLYNHDGSRHPFYRPALELMITYFANVVLLQMLDANTHQRRISIPSLVAASCMVRLYEEINCREHTAYLLPIHGFTCMIAAVPLIHYRPQSRESESQRVMDIGVIFSVLNRLRDRYGGSDLVIRKMQRLQQMVNEEKQARPQQGPWFGNGNVMRLDEPTQEALDRINELLPLPSTFFRGVELLEPGNNSNDQFESGEFISLEDSFVDMAPDFIFPLMDTLDMDFNCLYPLQDANPF